MEKPFTLRIKDIESKIIEILNEENLPFYISKIIIKNIFDDIHRADVEEISKYEQELEKEFKESENK